VAHSGSVPKRLSLTASSLWLNILLVTATLLAVYEFAMNLLALSYTELSAGSVVKSQAYIAPSGAVRAAARSDGARMVYRLFRVGALIPLLVWVFRAHRNLVPLEAEPPSCTPWWAVAGGSLVGLSLLGLLFFPWAAVGVVLGLAPLVLVLGETWKGSDPSALTGHSRARSHPWLFLAGWVVALVIVAGVAFSSAILTHGGVSLGGLADFARLAFLFRLESVATLLWAVLTIVMVRRATGDQRQRTAAMEYERHRAERLRQRQG
jgi:hypothetical protein